MSPQSSFRTVHPARPGSRPLTAEDLWRVPRVGSPVPLPDGGRAVVPVTEYDMEENRGTTRLHLIDLDGRTRPRALTSADASCTDPAISPDGTRLAFIRKDDPDENGQLHILPLDGGESAPVCEMPLGAFDPKWLPDGSGLVVGAMLFKGHLTPEATAAERDRRKDDKVKVHITEDPVFRYWDRWLTTGQVPHLFHVDGASGIARDLMPDSTDWFSWMAPAGSYDIHPGGTELAYSAIRFDAERDRLRSFVHRLIIATGERHVVAPTDGHAASGPRYTPDGASLVFGVTHDPDFYADRTQLTRHDLASGEDTAVATDWELSADSWEFGPDGALWITAQHRARNTLHRMESFETSPQAIVTDGSVGGARALPGGGTVFSRSDQSTPHEVYVTDASGAARRVTHLTDAALEGVALGAVLETTFTGAEGEGVQMFVALPPGESGDQPLPLVQVVHGGPHGISADSFHPRWNTHLFAAPGYVAAMVNFQGSTSFGQDFAKRIQGTWGDRPYRDVMAATDLLIEHGLADAGRMAAAGGSYGGYLVSWIAGQTDRFRCLVNHAGVFDTQSMFASDVIQARDVSIGGNPWGAHEGMDRWNPARHVGNAKTPMLVLHGELDYRVPVTQGLMCYSILRLRRVPARLVYFPDENHWVLKPQNSVVWYREVHAWLAKYLHDVESEKGTA